MSENSADSNAVTPRSEPRPERRQRFLRLFVIVADTAAGITIAVIATVTTFFWYESRPTPPQHWNTTALRASFDRVMTEGQDNTFLFMYVIENPSSSDFHLDNGNDAKLMTKLEKQKSLSNDLAEYLSIDYPIFIPAKHRQRVQIHLRVPYPEKLLPNATDQHDMYDKQLKEYLKTKLSNLNGFVLFDSSNRYEINFPKGW